jgi:uncharacterized protein (DUF2461 family)
MALLSRTAFLLVTQPTRVQSMPSWWQEWDDTQRVIRRILSKPDATQLEVMHEERHCPNFQVIYRPVVILNPL